MLLELIKPGQSPGFCYIRAVETKQNEKYFPKHLENRIP